MESTTVPGVPAPIRQHIRLPFERERVKDTLDESGTPSRECANEPSGLEPNVNEPSARASTFVSPAALHELPEAEIFALVDQLDTQGPRYTSYPTVPVWQTGFTARPYLDSLERLSAAEHPFALYVHMPFCRSRCYYCGCNSYIMRERAPMSRYAEALRAEIDRVAARLPYGVTCGEVHLGGGTPTQLPLDLLEGVLDRIAQQFPLTEDAERSVEVDPRVTSDDYLAALVARGFRRVSVGLQDLNPEVQRAVNRVYPLEQMAAFMARLRDHGFRSVNIDLMYGLPRQTRKSWRQTLEAVGELEPDRVACFGYAHLPQRLEHQRNILQEELPVPRDRLGMLLDANRFFLESGFEAIGMDHFARPDDKLSVARRERRLWRNFMGYTPNRGMPLVGVGCSAISELETLFAQNLVAPEQYANAILGGLWATFRGHVMSREDHIRGQLINNLMCNLEIVLPQDVEALGERLRNALTAALEGLAVYQDCGLLVPIEGGYRVTPLGQLFLRNLAMPFDAYLNRETAAGFSRTV